MLGESYPCPHNVPEKDKLGKGGNGLVVKFYLGGSIYALKQVRNLSNNFFAICFRHKKFSHKATCKFVIVCVNF